MKKWKLLLLIAVFHPVYGEDITAAAQRLDYDHTALLDVQETGVERHGQVFIHDISFASPMGGRVPAYLVVPSERDPENASALRSHAAIIWGHWYWTNSPMRNRREFLDEAVALAPSGVVSLLTDGPVARPGYTGDPDTLDDQAARHLIQQIEDMRRGADLLLARTDVDPRRLAYVGHSYDAAVGAFLAGVDKRFKAFVLMAGNLSDEQDDRSKEGQEYREQVGPAKFDAFQARWGWLDPGKYVAHAAPATVFLQYGSRDTLLSPARARAYAAIVSEPKRLKMYDAPHALNAAARRDRMAFLAQQLQVTMPGKRVVAGIADLFQPADQQ